MNPEQPIKLNVPEQFFDSGHRGMLLPLIRPYYKNREYTDIQRINDYGVSESDFYPVSAVDEADAVVIPMAWEYYRRGGKESELIQWLQSLPPKIPVWGWNSGDHGVNIPDLPPNVTVYRLNAYASALKRNERAMPPFFPDPEKQLNKLMPDEKEAAGTAIWVGFCGQARGNWQKYSMDVLRTLGRNLLYYSNIRIYQPHSLVSSTLLRHRVLQTLENDPEIHTDFIKRRKYRAGAVTEAAREKSGAEFLMNMYRNDYTVCLRGGGNFSVRLYETMAMGRIPLQVDTDCVYPLPELINWKEQTCYVEKDRLSQTAELLKAFHNTHPVEAIQRRNRQIWTDYLTLKGFFKSEYRVFHKQNV